MDYKDMIGPNGTENNMGGTEQLFYLCSATDVKTWGLPATAPVDPDDAYVIKIAHVMNTGKKFVQVYATIDTTELEAGMQGEIDGRSFAPKFKFFYPGSKKEVISFLNRVKGDQLVVIVPLADGTLIQLGGPKFRAYVKGDFKSDKTTGRGKGTEFEIIAYQPALYIYDAAIPLTAGA